MENKNKKNMNFIKVTAYITVIAFAFVLAGPSFAVEHEPILEVDEEDLLEEDEALMPPDETVETEDELPPMPEEPMPVPEEETDIIVNEEVADEEEIEEGGMGTGAIVMVLVALLVIGGVVFYALRSGE